MTVQVKTLMGEAQDIITAITAAQRKTLEYMASKYLTGHQIISVNQHTSETEGALGTTYVCFVTVWFDPQRVQ